jgi:hypothetical protein
VYWPPVPLSQLVLRMNSRCDLACDHCYEYKAADQSWRGVVMLVLVLYQQTLTGGLPQVGGDIPTIPCAPSFDREIACAIPHYLRVPG